MRKRLRKLLITGGAGFIGSEFVRQAVRRCFKVLVVDKLTYAGDIDRLKQVKSKITFYKVDVNDYKKLENIFRKGDPDVIVHFAAQTHVDRSIQKALPFLKDNINGTHNLLEISKKFCVSKFIHISTDEVYGDINKGSFNEESPLRPSSPYAASKAAADLFIKSYIRTYSFPAVIVRPCNNYGPWQYPEKLIPVIIYKALKNKKVPVYGRGLNKREWMHVSDCAEAIFTILNKAGAGQVYNVGSGVEKKNIDIARYIIKLLGRHQGLIQFVKDRPGHDYRYFLDCSKIHKLGWMPRVNLDKAIIDTVYWYKMNSVWLDNKVRYLINYWRTVYR